MPLYNPPASGGGAPTDATYIVQTANGSLSAEQELAALATGILKNTTTTGVLSIAAAGTDYAAVSHNHAAGDINSGTVATARLGSGTADATTFLRGDQTWAAPAGGSDPWTYQVLSSDFTTSSTTVGDVTQGELLGFAPSANTKYIFEAQLMLRTATATVNPRVGFAWATGLTDGVVQINEAQSATAMIQAYGNINAAVLTAVGGLTNNTQSWPCFVWGMVVAGASPSGNCRIQLSTETAGTVVRVVSGSWLRYRSYS